MLRWSNTLPWLHHWRKTPVCPVTNLSAGKPVSPSACIQHIRSATFHLWMNPLSFGPNICWREINSQKNNIPYMVIKGRGGNPPLTITHPNFLFHMYFNSLHPLFSERPWVPGTALGMLGWVRTSSRCGKELSHKPSYTWSGKEKQLFKN